MVCCLLGPTLDQQSHFYGFLLRSAGKIKGARPQKAKNRSLFAVRVLCACYVNGREKGGVF